MIYYPPQNKLWVIKYIKQTIQIWIKEDSLF